MNSELLEALNVLEKEKNISKDTLLEAIEQSLLQACKNHFGKADNVKVFIDPVTCEFNVHADTSYRPLLRILHRQARTRVHPQAAAAVLLSLLHKSLFLSFASPFLIQQE